MGEGESRTCEEENCSNQVVRKHATGRWPRFCPRCATRRIQARQAEESRTWRAAYKVDRKPVQCSDCSNMITLAEGGPLPTLCQDCSRRPPTSIKNAERRRKATELGQAEGRWATCQDQSCGVRFRCAAKGPIPQWCPTCKPNHVYDYRAHLIAPVRESIKCLDCSKIVPLLRKGYSRRRCDECSAKRRDEMAQQWWKDRPDLLRVKRRERHRRRRAAKRAALREHFSDREIFERDGWICQIGKHAVDPNLRHPDPGCATIDHVLPQSYVGWSHTRANVRLACLSCNNRRQNKVTDEDLRILGMRREDLQLAHVPRQRRSAQTGRFVKVRDEGQR